MTCIINDNETGPNIAWSSSKCSSIIDQVLNDRCILKPNLFTVGNLVKFDDSGNLIDSQIRVDDSDSNTNVLWSSVKTQKSIDDAMSGLVKSSSTFVPNKLLVYNSNGVLQSSQYHVDDTGNPSTTTLYTSQKWDNMLSNATSFTIPKFNNSKDGIVCMTKSDGSLDISGNYTIDDTQTTNNNLWSSQKVKQYIDSNVLNQCQDQIQSVNSKIQDQNTKIVVLQNQFANKLDRIVGSATNLAMFDSNGNLQDSGMRFDDSATPSSKILWTSEKIDNLISNANSKFTNCATIPVNYTKGNIPNFSSTGTLQDSGYCIDDEKIGDKILWSTQKQQNTWQTINNDIQAQIQSIKTACANIQDSKMKKLSSVQANSLLKSDADGNLVASNILVDDNSQASSNVLWTTNKFNSLNLAQFSSIPIKSQNLVMFDGDNKISDSGIRIDDTCTTDKCVWTAEKVNNLISNPKFFATGIFVGNAIFDNNLWYNPQFTISDSSVSSLIGGNKLVIPSDGYYYISIYGILNSTDQCEIQMQFRSGNLSNFGNKLFAVNFATADKYLKDEDVKFLIKVITPSVQASTSVQYPLKFYMNKI